MPPRRTLLRAGAWTGLAAALAAGVSGCGIRLEDDAPEIPFLSRTPIPDEGPLIAAYRRATALADLAARARGVVGASEVTERHTRQAQVLRAILDAGAVPERIIRGPETPTASAPIPATLATVSASALAAAVGAKARESIAAVGSFTEHRSLGASVAAHDAAGEMLTWPHRDPLPPAVANGLLSVTRACAYAVQVATAHLSAPERAGHLETLKALGRRESYLASTLTPVPAPPLGYRLPFPATDPAQGRRLVTAALGNLVDRGLDGLDGIPLGSTALVEVVRLEAEAVVLATAHGVPWPAFPGLALG